MGAMEAIFLTGNASKSKSVYLNARSGETKQNSFYLGIET